MSEVYFTSLRTRVGESLLDKMERLVRRAGIDKIDFKNKYVAIKMHFGELGNLAYIKPPYVARMVKIIKELGGKPFLTDCNTLYVGGRKNAIDHIESAYQNGFNPYNTGAHVIIADGLKGLDETLVPVPDGKYVKEAKIGRALMDADIVISMTHFKGHAMGGFGGSLKNIAIGCATGQEGKRQVHGYLEGAMPPDGAAWGEMPLKDHFMERMADSGKAIVDHFGKHIVFLNVLRRMSVDCDCAGVSAAEPTISDIGIVASTDILKRLLMLLNMH